ncbi:MAG: hypothetical protein WC750_06375 [Patescibacteria group bacterium]|jgi:hypothetical protein
MNVKELRALLEKADDEAWIYIMDSEFEEVRVTEVKIESDSVILS